MAFYLLALICALTFQIQALPIARPLPQILGDVTPMILGDQVAAPQPALQNTSLETASPVFASGTAEDEPASFSASQSTSIQVTASATISLGSSSTASASTWALDPEFTDIKAGFESVKFSWGSTLAEVISSVPSTAYATPSASASALTSASSSSSPAAPTGNVMQVLYPKGSINPNPAHTGGVGFYATPVDFTKANNVSLSYSIFFPADFDFVKAGKLPGLTGGHGGCSGGKNADDCFSTRLMWRAGGLGELYLYAPQKQTEALCSLGPKSICDTEYGASIGRGAWKWAVGEWTHVRTDVWLNTPGKADGGFNIFINDQLVLHSDEVLYRNEVTVEPTTSAKPKAKKPKATKAPRPETSSPVVPVAEPAEPTDILSELLGGALLLNQLHAEPKAAPAAILPEAQELAKKPVGFLSIMFQTFFGGHDKQYASPKDQYTYFADVKLHVVS